MFFVIVISSLQNVLRKDNSVSICHTNLQSLIIEMFKVYTNYVSQILIDIVTLRVSLHDLHNSDLFE